MREISNLLGYTVNYKADSRTIQLSDASQPAPVDNEGDIAISKDFIDLKVLFDNEGIGATWGSKTASFFKGSLEDQKN